MVQVGRLFCAQATWSLVACIVVGASDFVVGISACAADVSGRSNAAVVKEDSSSTPGTTETTDKSVDVAALIASLKNGKSKEKLQAMQKLRTIKPEKQLAEVAHLEVALMKNDPDSEVRYQAAEQLGWIPPTPESANALFDALDSKDPELRVRAANSVPCGKQYIARLLRGLKSTDDEVRVRIEDRFALSPVRDPQVLAALSALLNDGDRSVRSGAYLAIAKMGPYASSVEPLLIKRLIFEPETLTRGYVARALGAVGGIRLEDLTLLRQNIMTTRDSGCKIGCARAIAWLGPAAAPAVDDLIAVLNKGGDPEVRGVLAETMGKIGPPARRSAPLLLEMLKKHNHLLPRAIVICALGSIATKDDADVVKWLRISTTDDEQKVRDAAKLALKKLGVK